MTGVNQEQSRGEQRKALLDKREEKIAHFMRQNRPIAAIAAIIGEAEDYCRKTTRRLAEERGIDYKPRKEVAPPELFTETTERFRRNMSAVMHSLCNKPGQHPLAVSAATGILQSQQKQAMERPFNFDYAISQLGRVADETGRDFTRMMIIALLDGYSEEEKNRVKRVLACLNN